MILSQHRRTLCYVALGLFLAGIAVLADTNYRELIATAEARYGEPGKARVLRWIAMLQANEGEPAPAQLMAVNDYFNQTIGHADDDVIWGQKDYWATPVETIGRQAGDCEDYSIAKYISLLAMGVPVQQLRLVYVKANIDGRRQAHMVLAYYPTPEADPLVLDNLSRDILPASRRTDLTPVFSFNSGGLWVGSDRSPKVDNPETRISRWRDAISRMQAEGVPFE